MSRPDPHELFDAKHRTLQEQLTFQFPRWRVRPPDDDDLRQAASMLLWQQCRRAAAPSVPPFVISCEILVFTALRQWWSQKRGNRMVLATTERMDANPAPSDELIVVEDGVAVRLTRGEAIAEAGELLELWNRGYTAPEVARALGVTRQRVNQITDELGGTLFHMGRKGRWRFRRDVVDAEVTRRGRAGPAGANVRGSETPEQAGKNG